MTRSCPTTLPLDGHAVAPEFATIAIEDIIVDANVNPRLEAHECAVQRLVAALNSGLLLPHVVVFEEDGCCWLADGFLRISAYRKAKRDVVPVEIRRGTKRDAIFYAIEANAAHGLKLTSNEKRRAVTTLLDDPVWHLKGDREISRLCGCSAPTVATLRRNHPLSVKFGGENVRDVPTKHGSRTRMRVGCRTSTRNPELSSKAQRAHGLDPTVEKPGQPDKGGKLGVEAFRDFGSATSIAAPATDSLVPVSECSFEGAITDLQSQDCDGEGPNSAPSRRRRQALKLFNEVWGLLGDPIEAGAICAASPDQAFRDRVREFINMFQNFMEAFQQHTKSAAAPVDGGGQ